MKIKEFGPQGGRIPSASSLDPLLLVIKMPRTIVHLGSRLMVPGELKSFIDCSLRGCKEILQIVGNG